MANNLRHTTVDGEKYVNVLDLLKLMVDVVNMDGVHPIAAQAIDGLGTGIALALNVVKLEDAPENVQALVKMKEDDGRE